LSLLNRGILAAFRQDFHLSTCPDLAGHLYEQAILEAYIAQLPAAPVTCDPDKQTAEISREDSREPTTRDDQ